MAVSGKVSGGIGGALSGARAGSAWGPPGAIAGAVLGGIGGSLLGGDNSAEKIAEKNAELEAMETEARLRDMRRNMSQVLGATRGAVGASGLQMSGSSQQYYNMLEGQFREDISWEQMRGLLAQQVALKGGQAAQRGYENQLLQGAIGALGYLPGLKRTFSNTGTTSETG